MLTSDDVGNFSQMVGSVSGHKRNFETLFGKWKKRDEERLDNGTVKEPHRWESLVTNCSRRQSLSCGSLRCLLPTFSRPW